MRCRTYRGTVHIFLDEQFVERLIRVGRDGYGNGGQLELFDVPLVDGTLDTSGTGATARAGGVGADAAGADAAGTDATATNATSARGQRQRELLVVGPAAVVVLGQEVRALGLPYRPHRNAVSDVGVLVDGANVDGRVDT